MNAFKRFFETADWRAYIYLFLVLTFGIVLLLIGLLGLPGLWGWLNAIFISGIVIFFFLSWAGGRRPSREPAGKNQEFKKFIDSLADALIIYDQDFRIISFNPAAEKLFGIGAGSVEGKAISPQDAENPKLQLLVQTLFPSLAPVMVPRSASGEWPQVVDVSFQEPALEFRIITSRLGSPAVAGGQPEKFMKIIRDRTREVVLLKEKSEFITVASHQLKTPLTNITWALEALAADRNLSDNNREIAKKALEASQLLVKTVEDILDVAKIEEGKFGYNFEPINLVEFLNKILEQVSPQAHQAGVRLYFDAPTGQLPLVFADTRKLSLVLVNLLDNAIRYNVKNGEVIVKAEQIPDKPFLKVSVKDTGIGVPAEDLQKLFSKFFRADNALKFQTEGTGLGLYIARNIVRTHGGEIGAESELNRGSVFHFTLPTDKNLVPQREIPIME